MDEQLKLILAELVTNNKRLLAVIELMAEARNQYLDEIDLQSFPPIGSHGEPTQSTK